MSFGRRFRKCNLVTKRGEYNTFSSSLKMRPWEPNDVVFMMKEFHCCLFSNLKEFAKLMM